MNTYEKDSILLPFAKCMQNISDVQGEEAVEPAPGAGREWGVVKSWGSDKGFGFIGLENGERDAFCHPKDCAGIEFFPDHTIFSVFEMGPKTSSSFAKQLQVEESAPATEENEIKRDRNAARRWKIAKGFGFAALIMAAMTPSSSSRTNDLSAGQIISFFRGAGPGALSQLFAKQKVGFSQKMSRKKKSYARWVSGNTKQTERLCLHWP